MDISLLPARIVAKTNEYLDQPSVVGHEKPFLDHLLRDFSGLGLAVQRRLNLLIVEAGAPAPVFIAHVDRHGLVIDQDGRAVWAALSVRNDKYGEDPDPSNTLTAKIKDRYLGEEMFAYDRITGGRLAYGDVTEVEKCPLTKRILFTLDGLPPLPPGTPIALARPLQRHDGRFISGQLDNPISAAVLRVAVEAGLKGRFVFTAEEEIGRSAAHFLSWAAEDLGVTQDLVVLDTSPFDTDEHPLAGAVILRRKDQTSAFAPGMTARLEAAAQHVGAPVLYKDAFVEAANETAIAEGRKPASLGLTELGRIIQLSGGAVSGATLQIPTFNYHTNAESTAPAAILNMARTLLALG